MKTNSLLNTITQQHPHRTSVHSHLQSTAYHYNSILHAKSSIDNAPPDNNICLNAVKNKHTKNLNAQRMFENKKILKSLLDIQRNYTLYAVKQQHQTQINRGNSTTFSSKKHTNPHISPQHKVKSLKNPFAQKMQKLKISHQNAKLYQKISNAESETANKKQLKQWGEKVRYLSHFMDSNRQKQCSETYKKQFFSTYVKMRSSTQSNGTTMRLSANSLMLNPQLRTLEISRNQEKSEGRYDMVIKEKVMRPKRKRSKVSKHKNTNRLFEDEINYEKHRLLTQQTVDLSSIRL